MVRPILSIETRLWDWKLSQPAKAITATDLFAPEVFLISFTVENKIKTR